ncbi:MAG: hypothetical protein JO040_01590 [Gemmatimonadetes bacterium]|nr:hypothetical protein [Gemmatimonadota bacterium]
MRTGIPLAATLGLALFAGPGLPACAAQEAMPMHGGHMHHAEAPVAAPTLTAKARAQLGEARRATAALATPEAAVAAGYRPMFGYVPLQGEHYVRLDLVAGDHFDPAQPSVLMFAPMDGRPKLVGVAYAYAHPAGAPVPSGFDHAEDVWHTHPELSRSPDRELVMMHAWFVDTPGGPFARHHPGLPYLAAGLTQPAPSVWSTPAAAEKAYALGLALAQVTEPPLPFKVLDQRGGDALRQKTEPHRQAIRALVPGLKQAQRSGDRAAYDRLAAEAVAHSQAVLDAYRQAAGRSPWSQRALDRTLNEFMGREEAHAHSM